MLSVLSKTCLCASLHYTVACWSLVIDTVRMWNWVYETVQRPSVRPSVYPIDLQQQWLATSLLLSAEQEK